jgi:hypothetical protein
MRANQESNGPDFKRGHVMARTARWPIRQANTPHSAVEIELEGIFSLKNLIHRAAISHHSARHRAKLL